MEYYNNVVEFIFNKMCLIKIKIKSSLIVVFLHQIQCTNCEIWYHSVCQHDKKEVNKCKRMWLCVFCKENYLKPVKIYCLLLYVFLYILYVVLTVNR